jgi:hypothetical protein
MKKYLLIGLIIFSSKIIVGQTTVPKYIYCELLGTSKFLSTKISVSVDFGQESGFFRNTRMVDSTGNVIEFNSMVDAMNFFGEKGWDFVQAYVVTVGNQNVYHWLLKRELNDDEKASFIPTTKYQFKNKDK